MIRNNKVRQRLAAGKMRLRIRDLRNLGARSEELLAAVGVHSVAELRDRGAVRTYVQMRRAGVANTLNTLWALCGALEPWPEGRHWREVACGDARLSLLLAVEDLEKSLDATSALTKPAPEG